MTDDIYLIRGDLVDIRPITHDDTDLIIKWRNNKRIRDNFVYREHFTREIHENWIKNKVETGEVLQLIICEKSRGLRPVGSVYLRFTTEDKKEAEYGIFIGEDDAVGLGYGSETARLVVDYAQNELKMRELFLRVFSYNLTAQRSYESAGFVKYQDLPSVECSDGQKSDMILMKRSF